MLRINRHGDIKEFNKAIGPVSRVPISSASATVLLFLSQGGVSSRVVSFFAAFWSGLIALCSFLLSFLCGHPCSSRHPSVFFGCCLIYSPTSSNSASSFACLCLLVCPGRAGRTRAHPSLILPLPISVHPFLVTRVLSSPPSSSSLCAHLFCSPYTYNQMSYCLPSLRASSLSNPSTYSQVL